MKNLIHKLICWYLNRCGGAFHCYEYGPNGRYAVQMNDRQYHRYMALANDPDKGERLLYQENLLKWHDEEMETRGSARYL